MAPSTSGEQLPDVVLVESRPQAKELASTGLDGEASEQWDEGASTPIKPNNVIPSCVDPCTASPE